MSIIAQHADLLLILACLFGFFMAWGIGANDVANAMGTSVGSGAVTLGQAVIIAGVFEFLGAWLAGGEVTETISGGLIDPQIVADDPDTLVIGMLSALLGAGSFLVVTSMRGVPVSTGQSIVGGILGFALVAFGAGPVNWGEIGKIAASWVVSPLLAGAIAFLLFESIRRLVFNHPDPAVGARRYLPAYGSSTCAVARAASARSPSYSRRGYRKSAKISCGWRLPSDKDPRDKRLACSARLWRCSGSASPLGWLCRFPCSPRLLSVITCSGRSLPSRRMSSKNCSGSPRCLDRMRSRFD